MGLRRDKHRAGRARLANEIVQLVKQQRIIKRELIRLSRRIQDLERANVSKITE